MTKTAEQQRNDLAEQLRRVVGIYANQFPSWRSSVTIRKARKMLVEIYGVDGLHLLTPKNVARGEAHPNAKLTQQQVDEIRADKRGYRRLARAYGVSFTLIKAIRRGEYWAVPPN